MTSSKTFPKASDQSNNGKHHEDQDRERIAAELLDSGGQVVSIGEAELALEKKLAYFYPRDRNATAHASKPCKNSISERLE